MVVSPPRMFPLVGWEPERSSVLLALMKSLYSLKVSMNFSPISEVAARPLQTSSAPVISDVSPKEQVAPISTSLSMALPTVGLDARPEVVSDSPHLTETQISERSHSSRFNSEAQCKYSLAFQEALAMVPMSPVRSIEKPVTGLPVLAMPSTILFVHSGSMPTTTTAATLGFAPVPIMVLKKSSRSSPNWRRP